MAYGYTIYTSIPRDFDPEIEGKTLDSIVTSCSYSIGWTIPVSSENTIISLTSNQPIDTKYLIEQLEREFAGVGRGNVVLDVVCERLE